MCSPDTIAHVLRHLSPADRSRGAVSKSKHAAYAPAKVSFTRAFDLTHPLTQDFPTPFGRSDLRVEPVLSFDNDQWNLNRWHISEHLGTHIDAPIHVTADGKTVEQIPVEELVVPLAVIDISARADEDADTELTPDDIKAWEAEHGDLPPGCCVAMNSGWDRHAPGPLFCDRDGLPATPPRTT